MTTNKPSHDAVSGKSDQHKPRRNGFTEILHKLRPTENVSHLN